MVRLGALSDEMTPVLTDLGAVAPDINRMVDPARAVLARRHPGLRVARRDDRDRHAGRPRGPAGGPRHCASWRAPCGRSARTRGSSSSPSSARGGIDRFMDYVFYTGGRDQRLRLVRPLPARRPDRQPVRQLRGPGRPSAARPTSARRELERRPGRSTGAPRDAVLQRTAVALAKALGLQGPEGARAARSTRDRAPATARRPIRRSRPRRPADPGAHAGPEGRPSRAGADRDAARLPVRRRRMSGRGGIAGNPVLIGAATILVVLVAVFLAYNANQGLPFVPTYQLRAEVPSAANLVVGNDVRIGGSRVGFVDGISAQRQDDGSTIAVLDLTLERDVAPLPRDSTLIVRPRSALGLKYVEITRGTDSEGFDEGATIPIASATPAPVEFDEVLGMFDEETRDAIAANTTGFGDAFAGRGESINTAIGAFRPLLRDIVPVAQNLAVAGDQPAPLLRRAGRRGGDRGARRRDPGRAVREPRHDLPRAARGRAALHPGLDHRRRARARDRASARCRSSGRSCATPRACSASCSRAPPRCGHTRRRSPTRSWRAPARCRARRRSTAGSRRCSTSCRPSPRTRRCPSGWTPRPPRSSRSSRRWRSSPRPRPSATT